MLVISAQTKVGKKNNIVTIQNLPTNFYNLLSYNTNIQKIFEKKKFYE